MSGFDRDEAGKMGVHMISGLAAGGISTLVTYPLDLFKTRIQIQSKAHQNHHRVKIDGLFRGVKQVYQLEGIRGFYRGVVAGVIGSSIAWGSYFYIYGWMKRWAKDRYQLEHLDSKHIILTSTASGLIVTCITHPIFMIKIKLQGLSADTFSQMQYKGVLNSIRENRGYFKGIGASFMSVVHGTIQFTCYEGMRRYMRDHVDTHPILLPFTLATISKVIAGVATHPIILLRAKLVEYQSPFRSYDQIILATYREYGWRGFFRGVVPAVLRVTPQSACTFVGFEIFSSFLLKSSDPASSTV